MLALGVSISAEATILTESALKIEAPAVKKVDCEAILKKIDDLKSIYRRDCRGSRPPFWRCENLNNRIAYLEGKYLAACY